MTASEPLLYFKTSLANLGKLFINTYIPGQKTVRIEVIQSGGTTTTSADLLCKVSCADPTVRTDVYSPKEKYVPSVAATNSFCVSTSLLMTINSMF